jgi:hypothetical protein
MSKNNNWLAFILGAAAGAGLTQLNQIVRFFKPPID